MHIIKGLGLVADRALHRGEEIVVDITYFATDWNCGNDRSFDDEDFLLGKFGKWSFQQAVHYFKSRYHIITDKSTPMTSLRSSLGLRTVNPLRKVQLRLGIIGVWVSNINHARKPNAHIWIDSNRKAVVVTTVANINLGLRNNNCISRHVTPRFQARQGRFSEPLFLLPLSSLL